MKKFAKNTNKNRINAATVKNLIQSKIFQNLPHPII